MAVARSWSSSFFVCVGRKWDGGGESMRMILVEQLRRQNAPEFTDGMHTRDAPAFVQVRVLEPKSTSVDTHLKYGAPAPSQVWREA